MKQHQGGPGRPMPGDHEGQMGGVAFLPGNHVGHNLHFWGGDKSEDISPLPYLDIPNLHYSHVSRPVRQRGARRLKAVEETVLVSVLFSKTTCKQLECLK